MKFKTDARPAETRPLSTLSDHFEGILKIADFRENTKAIAVDFWGSFRGTLQADGGVNHLHNYRIHRDKTPTLSNLL